MQQKVSASECALGNDLAHPWLRSLLQSVQGVEEFLIKRIRLFI